MKVRAKQEPQEKKYDGKVTTDVVSFDHLIGKVFTHTELLGLTERQLSAYKSTLRQMFWDWYNSHLDNPHGFSDPSRQARVEAGLEPVTSTTSGPVYMHVTGQTS